MTDNKYDHHHPKQERSTTTCARFALCMFASLYTFAFVGALFGFGPMEVMLVDSGAFAYQCRDEVDDMTAADKASSAVGCSAQTQTIVNIGFLAATLSIVTPFIGHAIDAYGAPSVAYGMSAVALTGTAFMVVAATTNTSWLYWLVFGLLGTATFTGSLLSVQVGLYFAGHTQVRIIMWLNTLFDAGSCSYLFLWMLQEVWHVTFVTVAWVYLALAVALFGPACYFWTVAVPEEQEQATLSATETEPLHPLQADESEECAEIATSLRFYAESHMDYSLLDEAVESRKGTLRDALTKGANAQHGTSAYGAIRQQAEDDDEDDGNDDVLLSEKSPNQQLTSMPYILLVFFFSVSQISCNWSLITAADFLASLGDDDGTYLKIFTLMQPASILALPLVDAIIRHVGFGTALQGVNLINLVYIFIKCTSKNLHVHVITFVMVAAVRCFLYATTFSFLPSLLSPNVVGRGTGFLSMVGGIASFLNIPLNSSAARGDFLTPNLIYLVAVLPCTLAARQVQATIVRETKIKAARAGGVPLDVSKM